MRNLICLLLILISLTKSYAFEISIEGLNDVLEGVTTELESVIQDNSKSEEIEIDSSTINSNKFNNFPVEINLKSINYVDGCGNATAQYKFNKENEFQLIFICPENSDETPFIGRFKNISEDLSEFSKVSTIYNYQGNQYEDIITLNKDTAEIRWDGGSPSVYEYVNKDSNVIVKKNNETEQNNSGSTFSETDEYSKICKNALSKYDIFNGFDENIFGNFLEGEDYLEVKNKIISEKKTFICPECSSSIKVNLLEVNDTYRVQNGEGRGEFEWIFVEGKLNGYFRGWTLMDNDTLIQVAEVQGGDLSNGVYVNHLIVKKFTENNDQGTILFCLDEDEAERGYWTIDSEGNETRNNYYNSNHQKFALQVNKKTMEQESKKIVDKSKGGYKDFYFDMNISQIKKVVREVCPDSEFTDKSFGEPLGYWNAMSCIDFRGKKTTLNFYTSKQDTIDKIILKNVDLSLDSLDLATYYADNESGFVIYDELVGKFLDSSKYELIRFPTKEEIDLFNSFDDLKILYGEATINTVFKNQQTGNLVYHTMKRNKYNKYGYEYDLVYLSPNASGLILQEEDSKNVSDDDI
tara:strand:+ start:633 stop:2369 length:1737 start_codon:yes stop_codon:yes gene_type:complete